MWQSAADCGHVFLCRCVATCGKFCTVICWSKSRYVCFQFDCVYRRAGRHTVLHAPMYVCMCYTVLHAPMCVHMCACSSLCVYASVAHVCMAACICLFLCVSYIICVCNSLLPAYLSLWQSIGMACAVCGVRSENYVSSSQRVFACSLRT